MGNFRKTILSVAFISMMVGLSGCGATKQQSQSNGQKNASITSPKNNGQTSNSSQKQSNITKTPANQGNSNQSLQIKSINYNNSQTALKQLEKAQKINWFYPQKTNKVNLGYGITAQSGSIFGDETLFKWLEGRWSIEVLTGQKGSEKDKLAKQIVKYLHANSLPVPHQKGFIIMKQDISNPKKVGSYVYWQDNQKVYHIIDINNPSTSFPSFVTTKTDPLSALKAAVSG